MRGVLWIAFLAAMGLGGCSGESEHPEGSLDSVVVRNVSVIDTATGGLLPNQAVIVESGSIKAVGSDASLEVPAGAEIIDGTGKFLMPGLWDMHVHTSNEAVTTQALFPLFIANGITGVRSMAADCHVENGGCGEDIAPITRVFDWRKAIENGDLVGPRMIAASYYTNGPRHVEDSSINSPGTAEHARAYARLLNDRRVDLIKVYSRMLREPYFAMADEAKRLGLDFAGHVPIMVTVTEASNAGQKSVEHITGFLEECSPEGDGLRAAIREASYGSPDFWRLMVQLANSFDPQRCKDLYATLKANWTWYVPTLSVERFYNRLISPRGDWRADDRLKYVPRAEVVFWDEMENGYSEGIDDYLSFMQPHYRKSFEIAKAAFDSGVNMLAGSDPGEFGIIWGFSLHEELGYLVEAGLTPAQALKLATVNPARYMGRENELGAIEPGKLADMVLLEKNPLDDISNTQTIDTVIANGRVFRREDLDALLQAVEQYVIDSKDVVYPD
jgi:hypothetical protein